MHRFRSSISSMILIASTLVNLCCCVMNPKPQIRQISDQNADRGPTKRPSGPNDFIGHSLVNPKTNSFYKDPVMTNSGESCERESFGGRVNVPFKENSVLKKIIENYYPEQGWNFLSQEKIALIHLAINEYKECPVNLSIKYFLKAIVKQLQIPGNLYFLEFRDVKSFYDEIISLNLN